MDVLTGIKIINQAYEKKREEKMFQLYLMKYQHMDEKNFIPFSEFYKPVNQIDEEESIEDILENVKNILDDNQGRWRQ